MPGRIHEGLGDSYMAEQNSLARFKQAVPSTFRLLPVSNGESNSVEPRNEMDFRAFLTVIRDRRDTIVTVVAAVMLVAFVLSMLMHPVYVSESTLEIEGQAPDITTVDQLLKLDPASVIDVDTQQGILKSDALARQVIDQLHLTDVKEFNPESQGRLAKGWHGFVNWLKVTPDSSTDNATDPKTYEKVVERFEQRLKVDVVRDSRLIKISFESGDPQLSARIVNSLVSNYLQIHQESTRRLSNELANQVSIAKADLEESERRMLGYARAKDLLYLQTSNGTSESIVDQRLQQIQEQLTQAQGDRYQKQSVYQLVQKGDYGSLPGVFQDKLLQDLTLQVAGLQREYAQLSATFSDEYPKVKQVKGQLTELEKVLARERQRAAANITNDYLAAVRREALLAREFERQKFAATSVAEKATQYQILKRNVDTDNQLYDSLLQKVKEATLVARIKADNVNVVDAAQPRYSPVRPKLWLNLILAAIVGLGLGISLAFLQQNFDTTLRTVEEVDRLLGVPALAMIPAVDSLSNVLVDGNNRNGHGLFLPEVLDTTQLAKSETPWYRIDKQVHQKYSPLVEAFRTLGSSVMLEAEARKRTLRSIVVTSTQPGEGKTTVSVNLAIALAQQERRVFLMDADLRRPSVHRALSFRNIRGLASYLNGKSDWESCVMPGLTPGLDTLPAGTPPMNPVALLSSSKMKVLIGKVLEEYDYLIIDSPALIPNLADARILAELVDGSLMVVRIGMAPREFVLRARKNLNNVVGVVLNSMDAHSMEGYYGYQSYYSHAEGDNKGESGNSTYEKSIAGM
jgi:polysaccharide biosynthesis transport protein